MGVMTVGLVIAGIVVVGVVLLAVRWRSASSEQQALRHYQHALDTLRTVSDRMESSLSGDRAESHSGRQIAMSRRREPREPEHKQTERKETEPRDLGPEKRGPEKCDTEKWGPKRSSRLGRTDQGDRGPGSPPGRSGHR